MKNLFIGLLQMILASGILFGYYYLYLRNNRFHQYNRFYLLASVVVSILIPFLNIPIYFSAEEQPVLETLQQINFSATYLPLFTPLTPAPINWWHVTLYSIYFGVALLLLTRLILSLRRIFLLLHKHVAEPIQDIQFVATREPGTPFSFLRWLFWDETIPLESPAGQQVFRHEVYHIRQKHSLDILFTEVIAMIGWFNPFFHLIKKELRIIHEFLADQFAAKETEKWEYAELLLMQAMQTRHSLVNPFFHNQIKRRIAMITSSKKTSHQYLRKLLVLPLGVLTLALFAFQYREKITALEIKSNLTPLTDTVPLLKVDEVRIVPTPDVKPLVLDLARPGTPRPDGVKEVVVQGRKADGSVFETLADVVPDRPQVTMRDTVIIGLRKVGLNEQQPLYVIDGKLQPLGVLKPLKDLDPNTIQSINVLKDATAVSKYGETARNGVIEINTKKSDIIEVRLDTISIEKKNIEEVVVQGYATKIFSTMEIDPAFPGGENAWKSFVGSHMNKSGITSNAPEAGIYTVYIQFVVDRNGKLSKLKPLTNHGFGMEEEAMRLLKQGPDWLPGIQNGKAVNGYKNQAVVFEIGESRIYPNPAGNETVVEFTAAEAGLYTFTVSNLNGQRLQTTRQSLVAGRNRTVVNTSSIGNGNFVLSISDKSGALMRTYRLVKAKD